MPSTFAKIFLRTIPDLNSWFLVRLRLTEIGLKPYLSGVIAPLEDRPRLSLDEARTQANRLLRRFERAEKAGARRHDLIALVQAAVQSYLDAGAVFEASRLAEELFPSLTTAEEIGADETSETARSLLQLAHLYHALGKLSEAEPLYHRALKITERALGPDHPDTARSLNNLADLYRAQGKLSEAEPLYHRALEIRERALGPDHPDTATSLNNLAGLYRAQGKLSEAEPLYLRALEISERALGPDHPDTA